MAISVWPETVIEPKAEEIPPVGVYRFSLEQYQRLGELGLLTEEDRVELLEGWIIPKMVHHPPHDGTLQIVTARIRELLPTGWCDRVQMAVALERSLPEPDLVIARGSHRSFLERHPGPQDIGLLIEVAESSLSRDRNLKARIYAEAGIPVYWIVNLIDQQIEVLTKPNGTQRPPLYCQQEIFLPGDSVPLVIEGQTVTTIPVAELLP
jgi:Uma2 family endonuclease